MRASYSQKNGLTLELTPEETEVWNRVRREYDERGVCGAAFDLELGETIRSALFHGDTVTAEERRLDAKSEVEGT